ncbi:serine-rich adhesin for platelets isoform X2 [Zeugodacus cucurbitae]|uniref:serine-rich adhesin for platelets isoform X2 n=1 Tax=Zeugodacus cucurbitae TaxID=28588 RepID=UPI0023D915F9|nr:serine-rich adhesin for platelets isoform X2 [Zeugodacus cucurbitae]
MEHLDLAGVINTPTLWNMSAFDQQDAIYLSNSRQMLEPILEETSEDEEHAQNSWNQYEQSREHFWSSTESETGSVIRVEVNKDPDSISERDFACPAKRARRCDDFIIGGQLSSTAQSALTQQPSQAQPVSGSYDDTVLLRRTQRPFDYNEANSNSLERFLAYEACTRDSWGQPTQQVVPQRNSTGSRRFDEFSDSDSISYHSLSRSSSLIQFESLERQLQLQEQHASMSSLGNSSPSLLSFDGARSNGALNGEDGVRSGANSGSNSGSNSRRGSQSSLLKRFESSDGRLHQTYFDLDKLNFDDDQRVIFGASKANLMEATVGEVKSDSESSTSSGSSSGNSILTASKPSAEDLTDSSSTAGTRTGRIMAFQRAGKSSAENLSEDSGYCEPSTLRRAKSKSIPKNFEKFCEEEEEFQQYDYTVERHTVEAIDSVTKTTHPQEQTQQPHSKSVLNHNHNINTDVASTNHYVVGHDICQPKINDATFIVATDDETSFSAPTTPPPPALPRTSPQTPAFNGGPGENEDDVDECDEERNSDTEETIGSRYVSHVSACPTYEQVKNSPTREATAAALLLEQRRSLAHSPSPVASDVSSSSAASASSGSSCGTARSNTSASTCASAASFTWLPTPKQLQQQQQQLKLQLEQTQRETPASAKLELLAAQQRSTLENFCASLRNSLPDIRDALSTTTCDTVIETYFPVLSEKRNGNGSDVNDAHDTNGHGLEHARSDAKTSEHELIDTERSDGGATIATYNLDDSDFSTTSTSASGSASARESHSDETDNESTPEARKRQRVYNNTGGGGGGCIGATERSVIGSFGGYVSGGRRISSVPSELNKLGRRKRVSARYRQCKSSPEEEATSETSPSNSSVDEAEDEEDFFDTSTSYRIRRTCSWSERRERNLQRFEAAFGDRAQREGQRHWTSQSLGYMNASYQDLTQLDYSGKQLEADRHRISVQTNLKRCSDYLTSEGEGERDSESDNMDTPKSTASADYENIICKGNFLLDELSQIYDRNVSILNDKPIETDEHLHLPTAEEVAARPSCSPRPPPRQRKHSNSSYSDMESVGCADEQVAMAQHVQLTIRKPPARQKHARKSEATHSLISDAQFSSETSTTNTSSVAYGKTFDQDPTNLHTSYTQSLEKCNFDPKELSNSELNKSNPIPKRRFHSQANATKQRNMVSSTPNLNAYDPRADDVEDDMYVSSAHTSMHQLPLSATQKPLGILLPAGSRTSFSKEVSFCPVVSQYSWQEQSSEEYAEQHQQPEGAEKQEDTDDELLDNADATVIQNTRVNEMIAARYAAELKSALAAGNATKSVAQIRAVPIEKVRAMIIVRERQAAEEQERERARLQEQPTGLGEHNAQEQVESSSDVEKTLHKATDYSHETKGEALKLDSNDGAANNADYSETVNAGTAQVNVSHKSTIIDATTNVVPAEQTVTVKANNVENNVANDESDNDAQSNRNSSFSGASGGAVSVNDNASDSYNSTISGEVQTRPLSIHLPILSEPPINRAHHILYASQQLLDKFERRESEQYFGQNNGPQCESAIGGGVGVADRRAKSVGNLSGAQATRYRMSNATVGVGGQGGSGAVAANNNNELLNKKFKDEKHPSSKGFLSRFAHGLRFSLRRKNKKQLQQQQQQQQQQLQEQQDGGELNGFDKSTMRKSFAGTLPQQQQQQPPSPTTSANGSNSATLPANFSPADAKIGANSQQKPAAATTNNNNNANNNNSATNSGNAKAPVTINSNKSGSDKSSMRAITDRNGEPLVTGKPPKPYRYGSIPATTSSTTIITKYFGSGRRQGGGGGVPAHAHKDGNGMPNAANFKSRSQFYTDFLDAERSYYDDDEIEKQLDAGLQANGNAVTATATSDAPAYVTNTSSSSSCVTEVQQQTPEKDNSQRDTDNSSENASVTPATTERKYSVEYEIPSKAQETAQVAYSLPGVTRETVMLLTGATGSGVSNAGDGNGRIVAPTYTTMSNAYLQHTNNNNKIGLIETNLDTHETVISGKTRSLVDIVGPQQHHQQYVVVGGDGGGGVAKRLNMSAACGGNVDLDEDDDDVRVYGRDVGGRGGGAVVIKSTTANGSQIASVRRPHKSMEFLLDKENQKNVLPPENELQKSHDHNPAALSEHQLRVQASLQRLNIPDWFRQYNQNTSRSPEGNTTGYKPGNFTRKRTTESGRWAGLNSKTTSLSSLGSQRSDRSPLLLSPSAHSHHGGQAAQQHGTASTSAYGTASGGGGAGAFSRWSTSHLNSSQTSPSVSQRGSFTRGGPINSSFISVASGQSSVIRSSYRQPYLGWRSQEKLSQRTPHERLASSLLAQQQRTSPTQRSAGVTANGDNGSKLQPVTPEIQSSIKEVTSAIVHYVNDQTQQQQQQQQRSRSASPNSRKCWLESSFVGIRPLDSPQTPVIENTTTAFSSATNTNNNTATNNSISSQYNNYNYNYNYNTSNSSSNTLTAITTPNSVGGIGITTAITTNPHVLRMNGLSIVGGAPERSLSTASLEDVLASLLGLPSSSASSSGGVQGVNVGAGAGAGAALGASVGVGVNVNAGPSATSDPYARSTTTGDSASQSLVTFRHMPQQQQQQTQNPQSQTQLQQSQQQQLLLVQLQAEQQRLRRRSEGDAPQQQKQQQLQQQQNAKTNTSTSNSIGATTHSNVGRLQDTSTNNHSPAGVGGGSGSGGIVSTGNATLSTRRVSLGDSSESNNKTTSELQIKCRNTKCDRSATPADAKKYYKSCHNCTHLYCSRECRRAHWEKHRKACLHSRASNLCRQVLATCKDDVDSQRHLSLLARKGFLSQGRGVVRVLFRSAEAAESFIKHGFQCMGEASYVRWPDLMPAEMGLELYSELLKLSTEYKPDSKMLIYVAICVVSEAPGMGQAPVRWERQLVSRCAKLKLCKSILAELEQQQLALQLQQQTQPPLTVVAVPEPTTEILILTFNPTLRSNNGQGELILSNILDILSRRGVLLRKHYPEIYQRLQTFTDGQTDKFNPVTLHPRDSQTGKSFVCIIMPVHTSDSDVIKLPSASDGGNRVTTIDVGSPAALAQLDDDELLTRSTS